MKKFLLPAIAAMLCAAMLSAPALAQPQAELAPGPGKTASPRDWDKLVSDGKLLPSAVTADSAILMDAQTGDVLFEKDADKQRVPASITKIMTCLLALESGKSLSEYVTVGTIPGKDFIDASNINLKAGETITLESLLYGLMLISGNDAADAIAVYIGGSIDNFVNMMNQKAKDLGMTNTHYANTNGLPIDNHYTSAKDMATLVRAAQKYPDFTKIVDTYTYTCPSTNKHDKTRTWTNHNQLISTGQAYSYAYATGVKTGFTDAAQHTFVGTATKGSQKLIAVVLHDTKTGKWTDSITMMEYGFQYYDTADAYKILESQSISASFKNAAGDDPGQGSMPLEIRPKSESQRYVTGLKSDIEKLKADPSLFQQDVAITKDTAPIARDEQVGTVTYSYEGKPVLICDLLASRDVELMATPAPSLSSSPTAGANTAGASGPASSPAPGGTASPKNTGGGTGAAVVWLAIAALLLVLAVLTIRIIQTQSRNKRYRQYNYRQNGNARMKR